LNCHCNQRGEGGRWRESKGSTEPRGRELHDLSRQP
jgi:hypothetical protein